MAESASFDHQKSDHYSRGRGFQQGRPHFRGRGRGKGRGEDRFYNVQRTLNILGVSDLREHLNRNHQLDQARGAPPSDPSYNYLRDSLREDREQQNKGPHLQRSNSYNSRRGRGKPRFEEPSFIHNPSNIKVELSTSTGRRNFFVNDDLTLPAIKHIPDYQFPDYPEKTIDTRPRGSRSVRARGVSRHITGVSDQETHLRAKSSDRNNEERNETRANKVRSKSVEARGETTGEVRGRGSYRPRGHYRGRSRENYKPPEDYRGRPRENYKFLEEDYRGRPRENYKSSEDDNKIKGGEFKGKGRGRGRGRGNRRERGSQQQSLPGTEAPAANNDVPSEESWDNEEESTPPVAKDDSFDKQYEDNAKTDSFDNEEEYQEEKLEHFEDEYKRVCFSEVQRPRYNDQEEKVTVEDLEVTSSADCKNKKRIVRFKDDDSKNNDLNDEEAIKVEETHG